MTQEQKDKQAFFAQYWGQSVIVAPTNEGLSNIYPVQGSEMHDHYFEHNPSLYLKPLSAITDEDAIEVAKIYEPYVKLCVSRRNTFSIIIAHVDDDGQHEFCTIYFDGEIDNGGNHGRKRDLQAYDKLRELGYLLPFRSYTTNQILEMGWAKLQEI